MRPFKLPFFVFTICLCLNDVIGADLRIKSADEFINFKSNVNSGTIYYGTTVFLDSDLDFTGITFEQIGNSKTNYFNGTFDGQGHVFSNLNIASSSQYAGLFGYSGGLTIRNVIIDSSCSITSSYSDYNGAYVGGIIGACYANNGPCTIENSVNMASVTLSGDISSSFLNLGGIAGCLYSSDKYDSFVKNCANYGDVTYSGKSGSSYIGGVVGQVDGSYLFNIAYIYNSLNHGTITHRGTTSYALYFGGIAGWTDYTTIENCVSGGKISSSGSAKIRYVGSIVGYVSSYITINYCYFTSKLSGYDKYGGWNSYPSESNTFSYDSTTFELNETVSAGSYSGISLIDALNSAADYYTLRDYSHWLLNKEKKAVSFTINGRSPFTLNSQVILLPNLASEGKLWFDGWYEDKGLTVPLTFTEVTNGIELYGKFDVNTNNSTISFDTRREGVIVAPITASFGSTVTLPSDSIREHCVVAWWENKYGEKVEFNFTVPAHNITLYAVWKCTRIKTSVDFILFSKSVNKGVNYSGTTVFLDSDLDLAGKTFEHIGYYNSYEDNKYFIGIFDGQGHVISNLKMTSSSEYVGLFGYSYGLTIKNAILDSSCSITSSFSGSDDAYVGGIIGSCGIGTIENSVNMGSVTFNGNISSDRLYLGGIAGELYSSSSYDSIVKNCANYGDVTHSGTSDRSYIGGIIGYSHGYSSYRMCLYNSLNHGTITHSGTSSISLYIGGISGYTRYTTIENCVSGGMISSAPIIAPKNSYIGSIIGYVSDDTSINYCYYTSELNRHNKYGYKDSNPTESNVLKYDSTTSELGATVSVGSYSGISLVGALNGAADYYYAFREYSHWLFNKKRYAMSFVINGRTSPIKVNYPVILMPSLANEGNKIFDGWYTDKGLTTPPTSYDVNKPTSFYAIFMSYTNDVTFNVNGGNTLSESESTKEVTFDSIYGDLPEPTRTGYSFAGWFTAIEGGEEVKSEDIVKITDPQTLYAHWTAGVYIVTFNVNGGTSSKSSMNVTYEKEYGDLPEATRTGFRFLGWFTDETFTNEITSESTVSTPSDHILYAKWDAVYQLSFVFDNGTEPEVRFLNYNDPIAHPADPVKEGHTFNGWSETIESMPANDLTITALWTVNQYTITFEVDGGSACESIIQDYNTKVVLPEPTKIGYTFDCWCSDPELSSEYTETTMPAENVTLYAKWTINQYNLTFVFNNGTIINATTNYNDPITYPADPVKEGHTFNGWSETIESMPAHDLTITAQWTANQYTLRFDLNNGEPVIEEVHHYNDPITYPADPVKEGRTFSGWSETIEFMPAHDLTVKAQWAEDVLFVEITLGTTGMSEDEIIDLLKKYTNADFTTDSLEIDKNDGSTKITIKFSDSDEGNKFADKVNEEIDGGGDTYFRDVTPIQKALSSLSHCLYPILVYTLHLLFI